MTWKVHLGLESAATSIHIKYRKYFARILLIFSVQSIVAVIIVCIQILIRLVPSLTKSPDASTIEGVFILILATSEFIAIIWVMQKIKKVDDNFHFKKEAHRIFYISIIAVLIWICGLIIRSTSDVSYIWVKGGIILSFTTWICAFCYFETRWVLHKFGGFSNSVDLDLLHASTNASFNTMRRSLETERRLNLQDILKTQEGFEAMMRFLSKEYSAENLLCYVQISQYISMWAGESDIELYTFPYFKNRSWDNELTHYLYLCEKYITLGSEFEVNIPYSLRKEAESVSPGIDSERIIKVCNSIGEALWVLMLHSFSRFKQTAQYKRLVGFGFQDYTRWIKGSAMSSGGGGTSMPRSGRGLHRDRGQDDKYNDTPLLFGDADVEMVSSQSKKRVTKQAQVVETECDGVAECPALHQLLKALEVYDGIDMDREIETLIEYGKQHKHLIDDFSHVIQEHNTEEDIAAMQSGSGLGGKCDYSECQMGQRYYRNKRQDIEMKGMFWKDLMDSVHCYLYHLEDFGYRVNLSDVGLKDPDDDDVGEDCVDDRFSLIYDRVKKGNDKKQETNKYNISIDDEEKKGDDDVQNMISFSIGFIFYYWQHYKSMDSKTEKFDNINDLSGYSPAELYVDKKYGSLKQEILQNEICTLTADQFNDSLQKCFLYIESQKAKEMKASGGSFLDELKYGISVDKPISSAHLISVILYCDWTELCTSFSGTFRRKTAKESLESVKSRNREYWNWSRLLRETVEIYGNNDKGYAKSNPQPVHGTKK